MQRCIKCTKKCFRADNLDQKYPGFTDLKLRKILEFVKQITLSEIATCRL